MFAARPRHLCLGLLIAAFALPPTCLAQSGGNDRSATGESADSAKFAEGLPQIPPKEPEEALQSFQLLPGFRIELVAAEPLLRDPVAVDFDAAGRMYVVEYPQYNQHVREDFQGSGVVRRLEDTDGDGRYDASTVFLDTPNPITAVACYDGGAFVGVAPDILYCKDTDGDGRADVRERVFTGFGRAPGRAGQATLNSFRWGLDNRFHVCTNFAGGQVRAVDQNESEAVSVRRRGFLFDPRKRTFEVTSGGGQHGLSFDDWGRKFVCQNSRPIEMIMYDGRSVGRNPYLEAPSPVKRIAEEGKYTELFRISRVEPWRIVRTRMRVQGEFDGPIEGGGTASGYFTAATGVTVYRGDAWPDRFRNSILVGDVASNIIHRARLVPDGVGLIARRADEDREFLASEDNWFRPVQMANGPDGGLYVVDMYRELIEGAQFLPPDLLEQIGVSGGVDRGRIYRIVPDNFERPALPDLNETATSELVTLLEHENAWHRETAARLLYQRQDESAVEPLQELAVRSESSRGRLHALRALEGQGALAPEIVLGALDDPHPRVREHAVRLAEDAVDDPRIRQTLPNLVDDPDLRVRYQLAFSLGELPEDGRIEPLTELILQNGQSSWMRLAALSSLNRGSEKVFRRLASRTKFRETEHGRAFLGRLASQIGAAGRRHEIAAVVGTVASLSTEDDDLAATIVRQLSEKLEGSAAEQLERASGGERAGAILTEMLDEAKQVAADRDRKTGRRVEAVRTLGLAEFEDVRAIFRELLDLQEPPPVQTAALEALREFRHADVAGMILEAWSRLSPGVRKTAAETLFSRPAWTAALLDALEEGRIARGSISPARLQLLRSHPDESIRERARGILQSAAPGRRQQVVAEYQQALQLDGDAERGRTVFKENCAVCHRLGGIGEDVGADLQGIGDKSDSAVLLNILDPNREVQPKYLSYVLLTEDGRTVTGMITEEAAGSLTLRRPDGTTATVLRTDIKALRSTETSYMPEGLEKTVGVRAMADLLAFLRSVEPGGNHEVTQGTQGK